jgi:hypothetical protein
MTGLQHFAQGMQFEFVLRNRTSVMTHFCNHEVSAHLRDGRGAYFGGMSV